MARTHWQRRGTDAPGVVPWVAGMDAVVSIDLAAPVADGASLTSLATEAWRFPDTSEPPDVMLSATAILSGSPTGPVGTVVSQRLASLDKGRVYRIEFSYGPAGNRRESGVIVECSE